MPNYVRNKIDIYGREAEVKRLVGLVKGKGNQYFDFEKIIPMPEDIYRGPLGKAEEEKYGDKNWYDWSCQHWGTKWNAACDVSLSPERREGFVGFEFDTAWTPPTPVIEALVKKFPTLKFVHRWANEDVFSEHCGEDTYLQGELTFSWEPETEQEAVEFTCDVWELDPYEDLELTENGYQWKC